MNRVYKYNERATVCANKTCVTVYGDTARIVNAIVAMAAVVTLIALIEKAIK